MFTPVVLAEAFPVVGVAGSAGFQALAGGALAFAWLNWIRRGALYGGIYGRPIAVGNLTHGLVVALVMVRWQVDGVGSGMSWALTGGYLLYAAAFGALLYRPPWEAGEDRGA